MPERVMRSRAGFVLLVVGAAGLVSAAENLLRNPGFEEVAPTEGGAGPKQWVLKAPWMEKPEGAGLSRVEADRETVYVGTGSLRLNGTGNRGAAYQGVAQGFVPGDEAVLSAVAKVRNLDAGLAWIRAEFKAPGGKILGACSAHTPQHQVGTSEWFKLRAAARIPDGATYLQVFLYTSEPNTGTVWFDNVALVAMAAPAQQAEAAAAPTPRYVGLIPLDTFAAPDTVQRWGSGTWGGKLEVPNRVQVVTDEGGGRSLRIEFAAPRTFVVRKWEHLGAWTALCFRARQTAGSGPVSILIAAGGLGHYACGFGPLGRDWREYAIPLAKFANDRTGKPLTPKHAPTAVRFFAHGEMTLQLQDLRLAVPPQLGITEAYTDMHANVLKPGTAPALHVALFNAYERGVDATLGCTLRNYRGTVLQRAESACRLGAQSLAIQDFALPELKAGYYSCELALQGVGAPVRAGAGIVVMPPRPATRIGRPFVGFSAFGNSPTLAARLWMHRMEIWMNSHWDGVPDADAERQKPGSALRVCLENGMTPVGFFIIHPNHDRLSRRALTKSDAAPGKWVYHPDVIEAYLSRVAGHYRDLIKEWSVAGEANLFAPHLEDGLAAYVAASLAAIRGIRKAVPDAKVFGIGVSGSDPYQGWAFAKSAWTRLGPHLDGVYSDNYPSGWTVQEGLRAATPESYLGAHLRAMLEHMGPGKTIGVEEAGYQLDPKVPVWHQLARRHAEYAARVALIAAAIPRCNEYHWYTLTRRSRVSPWGLCLAAGAHADPYPGLATYATVARMLWDATEPVTVPLHREIRAYVYRKPRGAMAVLWSTAKDPVSFGMPELDRCQVYDADGAAYTVADAHLFLTGSPLYVHATRLPPGALVSALETSRRALPPVKMAFVLDAVDSVRVLVANQTAGGTVSGRVELAIRCGGGPGVTAHSGIFDVAAGGVAAQSVPIRSLTPGTPARLVVSGTFRGKDGTRTTQTRYVRLWPVPRLRKPPLIDADLSEYSDRPPIVLDRAAHICPPDAVGVHRLWTAPSDLSARAWTAWDAEHFYYAVAVTDAVHVQSKVGPSIWANDCAHIGFDMLGDTVDPAFTGRGGHDGRNDFEMGLALTKDGPQVYEWFSGPHETRGLLEAARVAVRREGTQTYYELAIPWRELGGYRAEPGRVLGFGFVIMNSNDGGTAPYWLQLTGGICGGKDPSRYDSFVLLPD